MAELPLLIAAIFVAGFIRGVTGFGFALAAVPLISMVVPPLYAVIVAQLLQIAVAPIDLVQNRRNLDLRALKYLFAGALLVAPFAAILATRMDPDIMRIAVAVFVTLGLIAIIRQVKVPEGMLPTLIAGGLSGLLAGLAAMPSPPAVAYFLGRGADKTVARASLLIFFAGTAFFVLCTVALTSDAITRAMLNTAAIGFPAVILGTRLGTQLFKRLGDGAYRQAALGVLWVSAFMTGLKGVSGLL